MTLERIGTPPDVQAIIEREIGSGVTVRETAVGVTVSQTPAQILPPDPTRLAFTFINLSVNAIHVGMREQVAATQGIFVQPSGGSLVMNWRDDLILPTREYFAIASGADSAIYLIEVLLR